MISCSFFDSSIKLFDSQQGISLNLRGVISWKEDPMNPFGKLFHRFRSGPVHLQTLHELPSQGLKRKLRVDVYLPPGYFRERKRYPLLVLNDGQDLGPMQFKSILERLYQQRRIQKHICVGVHAGDRMQEYGTAGRLDYKKRGRKAGAYTRFVVDELLPVIGRHYRLEFYSGSSAIAGFSLGGLSAFDIAWHHPGVFGRVGVFSGSLWWRSQAFDPKDPDGHRIVHEMVRETTHSPELKFWFQTGTEDETSDRNNNGIIDSIDDTLDLIRELKEKAYPPENIQYREVKGGRHDVPTWGKIMPEFLIWAFGKPV